MKICLILLCLSPSLALWTMTEEELTLSCSKYDFQVPPFSEFWELLPFSAQEYLFQVKYTELCLGKQFNKLPFCFSSNLSADPTLQTVEKEGRFKPNKYDFLRKIFSVHDFGRMYHEFRGACFDKLQKV